MLDRQLTKSNGRWRRGLKCTAVALAIVWVTLPANARAQDPAALFANASHYDDEGKAQLAFTTYLQAAEAGLPGAELNVAVMLDSGRGVEPDIARAATWYARAAAHGNPRAAYDLGQLYQDGQGVPRNADLARAWFTASGLPAAGDHIAALHALSPKAGLLSSPMAVAPEAGASAGAAMGGVELVWTSQPQPEPVRFFVEVRALEPAGAREVFSSFADTSALLAPLPNTHADYAWRVLSVAREAGQYAASDWHRFSVTPE